MGTHAYWHIQAPHTSLFPDVHWNKPERRDQAGKLGIIGGNKLSFASVADAYTVAHEVGVGQVRALVPDSLKQSIPPQLTDIIFAPSNPSGSLAREAITEMRALASWSDALLLIGDAGRNSETAIVYEQLIREYTGLLVITRDAADLIKHGAQDFVNRPDTLLVLSFAQIQKLFQLVYYPKVLTFSMQLAGFVEALHKFTITYPIILLVLHKDTLVLANGGDVITTAWDSPMAIWRGAVATKAAAYWLWSPKQPVEAVASSIAI
ncbi:MAG: hypothetical protein ACSLEY_02880 [Candidatus Saccharimonadales bacterium]